MKKIALALVAVMALTGCQTIAKVTCSFSSEESAADRAEKQLSTAIGNVNRGYAIGTRTESYQQAYTENVRGSCAQWQSTYNQYYGTRHTCIAYNYTPVTKYRTAFKTVEYPINIDVAAERRKIPHLRKNANELRRKANDAYNACVRRAG